MGVCPFGVQVRATLGISRKPDSSRKTRWAPRRAAFCYMRPARPLPGRNGRVVPLQRPAFGFLTTPPHVVQQPRHMVGMVVNAKLLPDQLRNPLQGPQVGPMASGHGASHQQFGQSPFLRLPQLGGAGPGSAWDAAPLVRSSCRPRTIGTPSFWRRSKPWPRPTGSSQLSPVGWPVGDAALVVGRCLGVS